MKQKIMVVTMEDDHELIDKTIEIMEGYGAEVIRFNTNHYPVNVALSTNIDNEKTEIYLHQNGESIALHDLTAIWYRRFKELSPELTTDLDPEYSNYSKVESYHFIQGMMGVLDDVFLFNNRDFNRIADCKQYELKVAKQVGLKIPKTCVTSNPKVVREFIKSTPKGVVTKLQIGYSKESEDGEEEHNMYTTTIKEEHLEQIDSSLKYCPMIFQEKIEKKLELRATVIGNEIYTIALDSSKFNQAESDWRRAVISARGHWKTYDLPQEICDQLLAYMDYFGLNYGGGDIILTPDDEYVFIEMNPGGEFGWVDYVHEGRVCEAIAKVLTNKIPRRRCNPLIQSLGGS